jgi:hypothetical protein
MIILNFKDWMVQEDGTSTACVATFSRPIMGMVRRTPPDEIALKHKKHKHHKKDEK